jgi:glycosyltransferase involved in cell wall biosynthesis
MSTAPLVSVIVPIRRAHKTIRATLLSLLDQCKSVPVEIVALVSEADPSREQLKDLTSPVLRLIVAPGRQGIPQLRRDGVRQSLAPWVIITEDHCVFPDGWLKGLIKDLPYNGNQVRGGPVLNGIPSLLGWAQYFTRYSSFMPPISSGDARALPGNNACYSRAVLTQNADLLRDGFWEAEFNVSILRRHCTLSISPELCVEQRQERGLFEYVALRFRHGRCYGGRRFRDSTRPERNRLLWTMPLIPGVLFWRAARSVFRKRQYRGQFVLASPLLCVYFSAWAAGEAVGYLFGTGTSCLDTD